MAHGFDRVKGGDRGFTKRALSSLAVTKGDLMAYDRANNVVIKATSTTSMEDLAGVATETVANTATELELQEIEDGDEYVVSTTNSTTAASNYERMVLTDENEVNNTGTDSTSDAAVFEQLYPVGAAADKLIRGRFVRHVDRA